ncbi:DNA primase catalytic subunit PriS [Halobacteriales archaeon QS_8_69_26]|nr:MAG: DNA primase catalytic subunit PriS [Halobacteriales archaeon QS_8_69_26]
MDERTREYLTGRFRDHYRRNRPSPPPGAADREWGFIPWTEGPGTTMVRHRSLLDLGDLGEFLQDRSPRHVYFSAGRYENPGARTMDEKGWQGSDLVFDLDADHLPSVDPETARYGDMLAACKDALSRLLDLLASDFGFRDMEVVFSGGRGYHVHVRDDGVGELGREQRREVVDYVRGNVGFEDLVETETVAGVGRETPAEKRTLRTDGGWSARAHRRIVDEARRLRDRDRDSALRELRERDGIGEKKAERLYRNVRDGADRIREGNIDLSPEFVEFARRLTEETLRTESAPIDEPVTTDTRRLIRLPGSLHGGSGLAVRRIPRDDLDGFDPLVDAVPDTFVGQEIRVEVTETPATAPGDATELQLRGNSFTIEEGTQLVPEYLGVFLMARGRARKAPE